MKVRIGKAGLATKLVILLMLVAVLLALFSIWGQLEAAQAERDTAARKVQAQKEINAGLAEEVARGIETDSISRIAREKLGLLGRDEIVFIDTSK